MTNNQTKCKWIWHILTVTLWLTVLQAHSRRYFALQDDKLCFPLFIFVYVCVCMYVCVVWCVQEIASWSLTRFGGLLPPHTHAHKHTHTLTHTHFFVVVVLFCLEYLCLTIFFLLCFLDSIIALGAWLVYWALDKSKVITTITHLKELVFTEFTLSNK